MLINSVNEKLCEIIIMSDFLIAVRPQDLRDWNYWRTKDIPTAGLLTLT